MRNFQDFVIWQKSHSFTLKIYKTTQKYPSSEAFGLTSQMRRAASSIPFNIAEGCGRHSDPDFRRFLIVASGSASEIDYQLILSKDLEYISLTEFGELHSLITEIRKMLFALINKLGS